MGGIIFLVIIIGIVLVLVVVAVTGSRKSKKEKAAELTKRKGIEEVAVDNHIQLYIVLDILKNKVERELANIATNGKSIQEINEFASHALDMINDSKEIKDVYKSPDRKKEFSIIFDQLTKVRANKWKDEAFIALNVLAGKVFSIKQLLKYAPLIEQIEKKYENWK